MSFGRNLPTFIDTNLRFPTQNFNYSILDGPFAGQTLTVPWFYGLSRPNTNFGAMTEIRSSVGSSYYGFVAQVSRRLTKGLQFDVNYTHSQSRDDGQASQTFTATNSPYNAFAPFAEHGISSFDFPNKFIANAVYRPHFNVEGTASKLLNGWQLSPILQIISGAPLNAVVSGSIPSPGFSQDPTCWPGTVMSSACTIPGGGVNGSGGAARFDLVGRNSFRLPKIVNLDMRVSRRFTIKENMHVEVLAEAFNVFNRTEVTGQNNSIYSVTSTSPTCNAAHTICTPASASLSITRTAGLSTFQTTNAAGGTLYRERQIQLAARFEF